MPLLATPKVPTSKVPVGSFVATCTGLIEDTIENSQYNPEVYRFYFDVVGKKDEEGNQMTTDAISSRAFSPKSKLWGWLEAFGLTPEVGKVMDLESVIGRQVMIVVKQHGEYTRVEELVPLPEGMGQPTPDIIDKFAAADGVTREQEVSSLSDALADAAELATIVDEAKKIGFSMKEITDVCQSEFNKPMKELDATERDRFRKALGV